MLKSDVGDCCLGCVVLVVWVVISVVGCWIVRVVMLVRWSCWIGGCLGCVIVGCLGVIVSDCWLCPGVVRGLGCWCFRRSGVFWCLCWMGCFGVFLRLCWSGGFGVVWIRFSLACLWVVGRVSVHTGVLCMIIRLGLD